MYFIKIMYLCDVCCVKVNNNNLFICSKCKYKSCKICCKKYFLTSYDNNKEPACMNCKVIINKPELVENFGIKWLFGKYMKHINKLLYQKQIKLLDNSKNEAKVKKRELFIIKRRSALLLERRKINKELKDLKVELNKLKNVKKTERKSYGEVEVDVEVGLRRSGDGDVSNDLFADKHSKRSGEELSSQNSRRFKCSYSCDGFLDEFYKCAVCSRHTCEFCYGKLINGHKCNNCIKQCPYCEEYFIKDEGCNLIKCSKCNTVFDWESGNIIVTSYEDNHVTNLSLPSFNKLNLSSLSDEEIITLRGMYDHIFEFIKLYKQKLIDILNNHNTDDYFKHIRISYLIDKITGLQFEKKTNKILKLDYYKKFIIYIIIFAYDKAISVFNNKNDYLKKLNEIINEINKIFKNTAKYFKYKDHVKIHHWFNLDGIKLLLQ